MKKLLSILLVMTMMLTLVSGAFAFAADEDELIQVTDSAEEPAAPEAPAEVKAEAPAADAPAAPKAEAPADPAPAADAPAEAEGEEAPAEGEELPAEGEELPAEGEAAPAEGEEAPAEGEEVPAEGEEAPAEGEDGASEEPAGEIVAEGEETEESTDAANEGGSSWKKANGFVVGQNYIIVVGGSAIANNGGSIAAGSADLEDPDASVIWAASSGIGLTNNGVYLYHNKSDALQTTTDAKANWNYYDDGTMYYTGGGNKFYVAGATALSSSSGAAVTLYTDGPELGSPASASSSSGSGSGSGSSSSGSSTDYREWMGPKDNIPAGASIAFKLGEKTLKFGKDGIETVDATVASQVMTVDKNNLTVETTEGGLNLYTTKGKEAEKDKYLIVKDGKLATSKEASGFWTIKEGGGPSSTSFIYTDADGNVWYMAVVDGEIVVVSDPEKATKGDLYSPQAPSGGPGGGGGSSGIAEVYTYSETDGPTFTKQPEAVHFVYEGSGYDAPTFSVTAELPEGSAAEGITFQWYIDEQPVGSPETKSGTSASSTLTATDLQGKSSGVYTVVCVASSDPSMATARTSSYAVTFIVCKGVLENSVLTFSDVHEVWNHVGTAIYDTIIAKDGLIPSLIISTGDFNNGYITGNIEEYIQQCMDEIIGRIALQAAGIDTVWVSGNHDNGYAADYTNWNAGADLGIVLDDYFNEEAAISGTGIIFDTRSDGYLKNADSSKAEDGLIVIGVNFEDVLALGGQAGVSGGRANYKGPFDYGDGTEEGDSVYKHIKTALDSAAENYHGELIVISSHAGLHALGRDESSIASGVNKDMGEADYNISNSAAIVDLVNSYVDEYGMNIVWLFGHDHSKGEREFVKLPGDTIISTVDYGTKTTESIVLKFAYGHAGYITSTINGKSYYTLLTWTGDKINRTEGIADGSRKTADDLAFEMDASTPAKTLQALPDGDDYKPAKDIKKALDDKAAELGYEVVKYYDVYPYWCGNSGMTRASKQDIPEAGILVTLPLPDGITSASDIIVLHKDGSVEVFKAGEFIFTDDSVKLTVKSLSPFAIAVKGSPADAGEQQAPAKNNAKNSPAKRAPKTGDESPVILYVSILVLCAGATAVVLPRKKFYK